MAEDFLSGFARRLKISDGRRDQVIRELRTHIEASRNDLELSGRPPDEAMRESLDRFGDPGEVADMLSVVHRSHLPKFKLVAIATIALAGLSAWLGTSHTFASGARHSIHHHHLHQWRGRASEVRHIGIRQAFVLPPPRALGHARMPIKLTHNHGIGIVVRMARP
ncbi:MAG TPA: permease prefix domain 1-containing protein [Chloroflexota bacterium]|jgi:hypothetical protein|nr:permease prefix domain 1-containing protein [Chloroflexota bacterium]